MRLIGVEDLNNKISKNGGSSDLNSIKRTSKKISKDVPTPKGKVNVVKRILNQRPSKYGGYG